MDSKPEDHARGIVAWQAIFSSFASSLESSVVNGNKASNGSTDQDALIATIDGVVETSNGKVGEEATKGDALGVDDVS